MRPNVFLYIYESIGGLTANYHDGDGLVIAATEQPKTWSGGKDWEGKPLPPVELPEPDRIVLLNPDEEPFNVIFPDAGCC